VPRSSKRPKSLPRRNPKKLPIALTSPKPSNIFLLFQRPAKNSRVFI
jgi:hypothetical protein